MNALQEAIHYSFIKFCTYCFSLWYEFLVHYALWVEKKLSTWSWCGTFGISISSAEGMSHQSIQNSVVCSGSTGKTPGLISRNNIFKKLLSASAFAMSWQDVPRWSLCSDVKECRTKRTHNFLFPKSSLRIRRTTVWGCSKILLSFLTWFDGHFWPNQQQQQCLPQFESILVSHFYRLFYQVPSVSKSRIPPKNIWSVHSLIPISLLHQS
jgi:hypothetical protein